MPYTTTNFKTKKALKEAVKASQRKAPSVSRMTVGDVVAFKQNGEPGEPVRVFQPGPFGQDVPDGDCSLEGPHYPAPHTWYARAEVKDGKVVKAK